VVCSAVGGIPKVVTDGETGLLFASGDLDGLTTALASILTDPLASGPFRSGRANRRANLVFVGTNGRYLRAPLSWPAGRACRNMNHTKKLRVAIVGCGQIADAHLAEIAKQPLGKAVAVCDQHHDLARQAGERFGVAGIFDNLDKMLAEARPDVVHVTTPPHSHAAIARTALAAGAQRVPRKAVHRERGRGGRSVGGGRSEPIDWCAWGTTTCLTRAGPNCVTGSKPGSSVRSSTSIP